MNSTSNTIGTYGKLGDLPATNGKATGFVPWLFARMFGLIAVVLVYGAMNFVLVGAQWLCHQDQHTKLDSIKASLNTGKSKIDLEEASLKSYGATLSNAKSTLCTLQDAVERMEREHPAGIPAALYAQYKSKLNAHNGLVDKYNEALSAYDELYQQYKSDIAGYNDQVAQANAVSKQIGSTWYVIPVPGRSRSAHLAE